jgi:phosphate transport system protein
MDRHWDQELHQIRQRLLEMGGIVEEMLGGAMTALTQRDPELARSIVARDRAVDRLDKAIDEQALSVIARHQPMAVDLRFLIVVMKIVTDLERMGDSAKNIAQSAIVISQEPPLAAGADLVAMAQPVRHMVRDSLDAFVQRNAQLARQVWHRDDEVDDLYHDTFRQLLTATVANPERALVSQHLQLVALYLERIADHATNICEDVIYFVEGTDIRHDATRYGEDGP